MNRKTKFESDLLKLIDSYPIQEEALMVAISVFNDLFRKILAEDLK